jgi:hypothetical protein
VRNAKLIAVHRPHGVNDVLTSVCSTEPVTLAWPVGHP